MKILKTYGPGQVIIDDVPVPDIAEGQLLVKIKKTAVSAGTELNMLRQAKDGTKSSLGYIAVGVVEKTKDLVSGLKVGDRVFVLSPHGEYGIKDSSLAIPLPEKLSFDDAVGVYWAVPAFRAIHRLGLNLYDDAAVIGQGPIGFMGLQLLRHFTRRLLAIDINEKRLDLARSAGADLCLNPLHENIEEETGKLMPEGPHGVLEATGTKEGLRSALEIVRPNGIIVALRLPENMGDLNLESYMYRKNLRLVSSGCPGMSPSQEHIFSNKILFTGNNSMIYPDNWYFRKDISACFDMAAKKYLNIKSVISHEIGYKEAPDVYKQLLDKEKSKDFLGVVINWES